MNSHDTIAKQVEYKDRTWNINQANINQIEIGLVDRINTPSKEYLPTWTVLE